MATLFLEFNDKYLSKVLTGLVDSGIAVDFLITNSPSLYRGAGFRKTKIYQDSVFNFPEQILRLNVDNPDSLSKEDINNNLDTEKLYLSITDRLCFYPKTVQLRQQMYYELLLFWKTFLKKNNITHIVYPRVPHLGYGNVVYGLAKSVGIKIFIVRDITVNNKTRISSDYLREEKVPASFAKGKKKAELQKMLSPSFKEILGLKSALIERNVSDNKSTLSQNDSGIISLFNIKTLKAVLSLFHWPFESYAPSMFYFERHRTWAAYYVSLLFYYLNNRRLWKKYISLSVPIDFNKNYIYFGLHYQPERTSLPEGDVFENQLLMIDILSKSLPDDCLIYVKEHPYQFSRSDTRQMNFRDDWYYEKIVSYKNVRLVKIDVSSQMLLKNSLAAVTLTGSTGLEALVLGKPVITFTPAAWYSPCRSCYLVQSQKDAVDVMKTVLSVKSSEVKLNLLKFLTYYQGKFISSSTESFSSGSGVEINELSVSILVKELKGYLQS